MVEPVFNEGDRVHLVEDPKIVGTVDETWISNLNQRIVNVVWDISGCMGSVSSKEIKHEETKP